MYFSRIEDAERAYRASLAVADTPQVRELLALNLVKQRKPDEAWELVQHVLEQRKLQSHELLLLIAEAYQTWGMHDAALAVLDAVVGTFPALARSSAQMQLREVSTRHRATGKPIASSYGIAAQPTRGRRVVYAIGRAVPLVLLVGVCTWLAVFAYRRSWHTVYVVNGLDAPYEVEIDGERLRLPPASHACVELREGEHSVRVVDGVPIPDQSFDLDSGLMARLLDTQMFVLNPDRAAVLLWSQAYYAKDAAGAPVGTSKLHASRLLYSFGHVDFPFREFPSEIVVSREVTEKRTSVRPQYDLDVFAIEDVLPDEMASECLSNRARYGPDDELVFGRLLDLLPPKELIALTEPLRKARPVRVQAHRYYQEARKALDPLVDLTPEYRAFRAASPDDPAWAYLLGRLLIDRAEAEKLYVQAAEHDPPLPAALAGYAHALLERGEAKQALAAARRGLKLDEKSVMCAYALVQSLDALDRAGEALEFLRSLPPREMYSQRVVLETYLMARRGHIGTALARIEELAAPLAAAERSMATTLLKENVYYTAADFDSMLSVTADSDLAMVRFRRAVMQNDLEMAEKQLDRVGGNQAPDRLLLAVIAHHNGSPNAKHMWQKAVAALRTHSRAGKKLAQWLEGEEPPEVEVAGNLDARSWSSVAMAALGERFKSRRKAFYRLARRGYRLQTFPYYEIERIASSD
jgi:tetratricopeptide (TPR) repeat protein